jgi:hypothetical protein
MTRVPYGCVLAGLLLLAGPSPSGAADKDDDEAPKDTSALPALTAEQQRAAGIVVAHPVAADVAQRDAAIGLILDGAAFVAQAGEADAAAAAARAAGAETERVRGLYSAGTSASLKALQSAQAEQARAKAQADAAAAKFASQWRPLAALAPAARQKLVDDVAGGSVLLVRAELPGRHVLGSVPDRALLDADGIGVPGRVLGALAQRGEETQGAAVLIEVRNAPAGLGPGARVPVTLLGAKHSGVVVPRDAVLYDDRGALVYKRLAAPPGEKLTHYKPERVKLLQAHADGWLVDGIDNDDDIVVHGAGVLWSLQGLVGHAAGDIDDDD